MRTINGYGWRPDFPDTRDEHYEPGFLSARPVPKAMDLRVDAAGQALMPPVYDQGNLGSCTANAICGAYAYAAKLATGRFYLGSRLFLYYNERAMEGNVGEDAGGQIRDGVKSTVKLGLCPESAPAAQPGDLPPSPGPDGSWAYDEAKFAERPPAECYAAAVPHETLRYRRVAGRLTDILHSLADRLPVIFGFTVYEGFESEAVARTGMLEMPKPSESVVGGHAVVAVGFDQMTQRLLVRNSWGLDWGLAGHFWMPFEYMLALGSDRWVFQSVAG